METITSFDNQKIKHVKKLLEDKKYRKESGEYAAEGARWVFDALRLAPAAVSGVFASESFIRKNGPPDTQNLFAVSDSVFDKVSATRNGQGILGVLKIPKSPAFVMNPHCLYLDGVRDPGNLGSVIRTAAAAGFADIILDSCSDPYSPKAVRSTMTAILSVNIFTRPPEFSKLKKEGYTVFAADMCGENIFTNQTKHDKLCLIIGSEADGIRPEILSFADKTVSVPMQSGIESLNAGVAAGILMYQLRRS